MSTHLRNDEEELLDSDPTDELPVLLDAAGIDDGGAEATGELDVVDDTWQGDATRVTPGSVPPRGPVERSALESLQRHLDEVEQRLLTSERELLDKSAAIAALDAALADARRSLAAQEAAAAELRDTLAARDTELDGLHAEVEAVRAERDASRADLAAVPPPDRRLQLAQDELAALATYIENRRLYWDEIEARCARQERRIAELELEIEQRLKRQRAAEEAAATETARAAAWRAELSAALRHRDLDRNPAVASAANTASDGEDRARAEAALEHLREELTQAYGQLAQTRNELARLERALGDRDRALASRDERIVHLERELAVRFAPPPQTLAEHRPLGERGRGEPIQAQPRPRPRLPASGPQTAVLVAVNDTTQRRYSVVKPITTIGRSSQCDIQVLTQFVSREHARLVADGLGVIVEDLGSTNGVFVNAARIERQLLAHGDLVTIGETQFRYLEAATH
jgi:hypothetical protein